MNQEQVVPVVGAGHCKGCSTIVSDPLPFASWCIQSKGIHFFITRFGSIELYDMTCKNLPHDKEVSSGTVI